LLLGPGAYALQAVESSYNGPIPSAGPASSTGFGPRGPGGGGAETSSGLIAYLEQNQGQATWLVAVQSAQSAASIELATGKAVLAMGGFSGSDPAPTAEQLAALVSSGRLRYVLLGGTGAGPDAAVEGGRFQGPPPGAATGS